MSRMVTPGCPPSCCHRLGRPSSCPSDWLSTFACSTPGPENQYKVEDSAHQTRIDKTCLNNTCFQLFLRGIAPRCSSGVAARLAPPVCLLLRTCLRHDRWPVRPPDSARAPAHSAAALSPTKLTYDSRWRPVQQLSLGHAAKRVSTPCALRSVAVSPVAQP